MKNAVFLNSAKLDYDNCLDYSSIAVITNLVVFKTSHAGEMIERVKNQNIVITKELPMGRDIIMQLPDSVKLVCEAGTGYNNIDIQAAREKNIMVCNIPGYSTEAVAQLTLTMILTLASSMAEQQVKLKQKNHDYFEKAPLFTLFELKGKTLGVIGFGKIGQEVTRLCKVFGMNCIVYARTPRQGIMKDITFVPLNELFRQSDFVTIHCPLTDDTKQIINKEKIGLMKRSSYIINTARGGLINERDLIEALATGVIAGAGLDVQDPEPPLSDNPLFAMDNVILTPHIGWKPIETRQRLVGMVADNIKSFLDSSPINIVN
jgi:glycerate dehydrogenase